MTVITVSRQFGSGGDEIVNNVCQKTGYHQFGKFQISQAAFEAGLSSPESIDYSEDNYKVKNFIERLFKRPARVTQV
ncbi:MAG: cytidylate kinase-like family protein, partial [Anaerolineae bacterium]|nr:cytidylate kinase-like family protein [Anaerolineae bacterium]